MTLMKTRRPSANPKANPPGTPAQEKPLRQKAKELAVNTLGSVVLVAGIGATKAAAQSASSIHVPTRVDITQPIDTQTRDATYVANLRARLNDEGLSSSRDRYPEVVNRINEELNAFENESDEYEKKMHFQKATLGIKYLEDMNNPETRGLLENLSSALADADLSSTPNLEKARDAAKDLLSGDPDKIFREKHFEELKDLSKYSWEAMGEAVNFLAPEAQEKFQQAKTHLLQGNYQAANQEIDALFESLKKGPSKEVNNLPKVVVGVLLLAFIIRRIFR